ncbi:hypothetical protein NF867_03760, partial [Solitalea sp. MAHUQ-68]
VSGPFTYTINLTGGCGTVSTTGTIKVLDPITYTYKFTNVVCKNETTPTGAIIVTPAGGSGNYKFILKLNGVQIDTGTGTGVFTFDKLVRGSYSVEVEDATYGCPGTCNGLTP